MSILCIQYIHIIARVLLLSTVSHISCYVYFLVGLTLDDQCYLDRQCTATPNAGVCRADQNNNGMLVCQCTRGYFRHNTSCLQGLRRIKTIYNHLNTQYTDDTTIK